MCFARTSSAPFSLVYHFRALPAYQFCVWVVIDRLVSRVFNFLLFHVLADCLYPGHMSYVVIFAGRQQCVTLRPRRRQGKIYRMTAFALVSIPASGAGLLRLVSLTCYDLLFDSVTVGLLILLNEEALYLTNPIIRTEIILVRRGNLSVALI